MDAGRLIYVMGASGVGKDSLMREVRPQLSGSGFLFAHRYITRPASAGGENHVALTREEFQLRLASGFFALHWESHGNRYGIGREIDLWLAAGRHVVMNGSRAYLPTARERYPSLLPVLVTVAREALRARLVARGRESEEEIRRRIERAEEYAPEEEDCLRIDNSGVLDDAAHLLVDALHAAVTIPISPCRIRQDLGSAAS